ncbi:MAG: hypothetical protein K8R58_00940 [Bacteroidales bacterium]|nr:hypothetical protein [Bacteroidales bacterium]
MKLKILLVFFLFSLFNNVFPQVEDSTVFTPMIYAGYSYQIPGGNLSELFGNNSNIGFGFQIKTKKNWIFGIDYNYLFGNNVKNENSLLSNITTSNGYIIDGNGIYAEINIYERGFLTSLKFGKVFSLFGPNPNSGIIFISSAGFLQYKIRIDNIDNTAPQLKDDYKKGYDRLTNGFAISEFIGYLYLGKNRLLNFFAGFEFTQAWTQSRRDINFNTRKPDDPLKHFDTLSGIKVGWIIPFNRRTSNNTFYY